MCTCACLRACLSVWSVLSVCLPVLFVCVTVSVCLPGMAVCTSVFVCPHVRLSMCSYPFNQMLQTVQTKGEYLADGLAAFSFLVVADLLCCRYPWWSFHSNSVRRFLSSDQHTHARTHAHTHAHDNTRTHSDTHFYPHQNYVIPSKNLRLINKLKQIY